MIARNTTGVVIDWGTDSREERHCYLLTRTKDAVCEDMGKCKMEKHPRGEDADIRFNSLAVDKGMIEVF